MCPSITFLFFFFFFNDTATTEIYTLSLHDALPIDVPPHRHGLQQRGCGVGVHRSEEHTSELQSRQYLVCRLLLEKKKTQKYRTYHVKKKKDVGVTNTTLRNI